MGKGNDTLLLPYSYTLSVSTVGLLLHLQCCHRCETISFKIWGKINLIYDNKDIINYWLRKKDNQIRAFEELIVWKWAVDLKKFSSNTIFRWYTFGKFHIDKFNYSHGRPLFS